MASMLATVVAVWALALAEASCSSSGKGEDAGSPADGRADSGPEGHAESGPDGGVDSRSDGRRESGKDGGDGSVQAFQSCAPGGMGMTNCGPDGGSESCCTSLEVPGNVDGGALFYRTYANDGGDVADAADPATVTSYRLDKYEVTVGRFRQYVNAWKGGYVPPAGSGKHSRVHSGKGLANSATPGSYETGWLASDDGNVSPTDLNLLCSNYATWTPSAASNERLPINCVNWWEAYAFCIWDGGFLPSESEWEYAAAGGSEELEYPWGTAAPGTGSEYAIYGCDYPSGSGTCTNVSNIAPVGTATLGAGRWGQLDLAGNVWEWTLDWYASYVDPCVDCAYLTATSNRVIRGGGYGYGASRLLPPYRNGPPLGVTGHGDDIGLRCARSAP